jgi:hypothetical protein
VSGNYDAVKEIWLEMDFSIEFKVMQNYHNSWTLPQSINFNLFFGQIILFHREI